MIAVILLSLVTLVVSITCNTVQKCLELTESCGNCDLFCLETQSCHSTTFTCTALTCGVYCNQVQSCLSSTLKTSNAAIINAYCGSTQSCLGTHFLLVEGSSLTINCFGTQSCTGATVQCDSGNFGLSDGCWICDEINALNCGCVKSTSCVSENSTQIPTNEPSKIPSIFPTKFPTLNPTTFPTNFPSHFPSKLPTQVPTNTFTEVSKKSPAESEGWLIFVYVVIALVLYFICCIIILRGIQLRRHYKIAPETDLSEKCGRNKVFVTTQNGFEDNSEESIKNESMELQKFITKQSVSNVQNIGEISSEIEIEGEIVIEGTNLLNTAKESNNN